MDPLTITLGAISLLKTISALNQGLRWIINLANAPTEFLDLQNELETVQGYLSVLSPMLAAPDEHIKSSTAVDTSQTRLHVAEISKSLEQDVAALVRMTDSIRAQVTSTPDKNGRPRIKPLQWRRNSANIGFFRDKIRRRRIELADATNLLQSAQQQNQASLMLDIQKITRLELAAVGGLVHKSAETLQQSIHDLSLQQPSEDSKRDLSYPDPPPYSPRRSKANELVRIQTVVHQQCPPTCPCQCHEVHQIHTQNRGFLFQKIVGQFFLSYNGIPSWSRAACDSTRCLQGQSKSVRLIYIFPDWMFRKAVDVYVSWKSLTGQGASLSLRIPRVISGRDDVYWAIAENQVSVVQSKLTSREILPTDISDDYGMSLLGYSLIRNNGAEVAEFLLPMAGDLFATDVQGRSPWYYARVILYSGSSNEPGQTIVCKKILDQCGDEVGDTIVHQSFFGQTPLSLEDALASDPSALDVPDRNGFTPLHWAAIRGDLPAMRLLLSWKADLETRDFLGRTPIHHVIKWNRTGLVACLLEAGADINAITTTGMTPLFEATRQNSQDVFAYLIERGAKSPTRAATGLTIFHVLTPFEREVDSTFMCDLMIEYGYDINARCHRGWTPMMYSIWYDDPVGVRAMVTRGADLALVDLEGRSTLHLVALQCTHEVMDALEGKLNGLVEVDAEDDKGKTAAQHFQERRQNEVKGSRPATVKDAEAFERLLASVSRGVGKESFQRRDGGDSSDDESLDNGEEFHDAAEVM